MTLAELKKVTAPYNLVRVRFYIDAYSSTKEAWNVSDFTKEEQENMKVVKVLGTHYPMFDNVIEVTVKKGETK